MQQLTLVYLAASHNVSPSAGKKKDFPNAFNLFNEMTFGKLRGQPLMRWAADHVLAKAPHWFEDNKAADALLCLQKISRNERVDVPLYRAALQQAISLRPVVSDLETLAFCYEVQSTIVESLCNCVVRLALAEPENRAAVKEGLLLLKDVRADIQASQEYCDKFAEEVNTMYEAYFSSAQNQKEKPAPGQLLPLEFASFFFKSLSAMLLRAFKPVNWSAVAIEAGRRPPVEMCVEHLRLFTISAMLMLAVFYLRLRIRKVKSSAEGLSGKFALIPLTESEYSSVTAVKRASDRRSA